MKRFVRPLRAARRLAERRRRASRRRRGRRARSIGARRGSRFATSAGPAHLRAHARLQPAELLPRPARTRPCRSSSMPTSARSSISAATRASTSTTGRAPSARAPTEGRILWNSTFRSFADYWGFEPRLCQPYRAQTKGKVESGVKYLQAATSCPAGRSSFRRFRSRRRISEPMTSSGGSNRSRACCSIRFVSLISITCVPLERRSCLRDQDPDRGRLDPHHSRGFLGGMVEEIDQHYAHPLPWGEPRERSHDRVARLDLGGVRRERARDGSRAGAQAMRDAGAGGTGSGPCGRGSRSGPP